MGRGPSTSFQCTIVTITSCAHCSSRCLKCFLPARTQGSHLTNVFSIAHRSSFRLYSVRVLLLHFFSSNMPYMLKNWTERVYVWHMKKPQSPVHQFVKKKLCNQSMGARGGAVGWGIALQARRSRVRFPMVSEFFIDIIIPAALRFWGWLSL